MKKGAKIAGIVVAVLVALAAALAGVARLVITPERVKATVASIAQRSLHREVRLGEIKISIFSGIVVKDLAVMEKDGRDTFIAAEQLLLHYQFWPLLKRHVIVDEVTLDKPKIKVVRLPDGTFNYSDITAKKEAPQAPKPKAKEELDLLVSKLEVTDGFISFEDRAVTSGPPVIYKVSSVDLSAKDLSPERQFPFEVKGRIPGLQLAIEGKVADLATKAQLDATVKLLEGDLQKLAAGLPQLAAKARSYNLAGTFDGQMHVAGLVATPKQLLKGGEVDLKEVQLTASGQRLQVKGKLDVKPDALSSRQIELTMGQNRMNIAFSAGNLFSKPITLNSTVTAENFNLDPLLGKPAAPAAAGGAAKPEPGPLNLPVRATGSAQLGRTAYKGLPITQLRLKYRLIDNVLNVDELRGNIASGSFADSARVDLRQKGFRYSTKLSLRGIQAEQLVQAFAPKAAGTLTGTVAANAELSGSGVQTAAMKRNLTGNGDFNITNGRISRARLVQGLAQYVNLGELHDIPFNNFAGTFRIANGQLTLDSGVSGRDLQLTPKGRVGLMDDSLDLSLMTRLSPALTAKVARGGVAKYVTDEKGWGMIPLKVGGTLSAPKYRLDSAAVGEQLRGKAQEKIQKTIEEKIFKKKEGEPQRPEREILERGLKGIFGK